MRVQIRENSQLGKLIIYVKLAFYTERWGLAMWREQQAASGQGGESGIVFALRARPVYFNAPARMRYRGLTSALTVASFLAMAGSGAIADDATARGKPVAQPTNEQLIEKLDRMEARIRALESELHRKGETAESKTPKARTAASRGTSAKAPAGAKDTAPGSPAYNETAALESPPPANPAPAENLAPAPGYLGAKETAALEPPPPNNAPRSQDRRLWRIPLRGATKSAC
jgi:hypothetical protein